MILKVDFIEDGTTQRWPVYQLRHSIDGIAENKSKRFIGI
jgi:hypothetical protein